MLGVQEGRQPTRADDVRRRRQYQESGWGGRGVATRLMSTRHRERVVTQSVFDISEHRGERALRDVEADWRRLYDVSANRAVFHSFDAVRAYVDHLCREPHRFRCLTLSDTGGVRAICPLETRTEVVMGARIRVLGLPTHPHWPLTDVLCPDDDTRRAILPELYTHLRRNPDTPGLLVLGPVPASSPAWDGLSRVPAWKRFMRSTRPSDVFDCTRTYDELMSRLSKHFRRNLRAADRKLSQLPAVRLVTVRDPSGLACELDSFMEVERSGWKGQSGTASAVALHADLIAFYRDLTQRMGRRGECEINTLYAEGRCIAAQVCTRTGEEYAIHKIGYDEGYGRVAPGLMLLQDTLRRCCADPVIKRMSLVTDGPWQRDWHPECVATQTAYVSIRRLGQAPLELVRLRHGYGPPSARWVCTRLERSPLQDTAVGREIGRRMGQGGGAITTDGSHRAQAGAQSKH